MKRCVCVLAGSCLYTAHPPKPTHPRERRDHLNTDHWYLINTQHKLYIKHTASFKIKEKKKKINIVYWFWFDFFLKCVSQLIIKKEQRL